MHTAAYALKDQERMARAKNYFAWQGAFVTRALGQRVLEVGCGIGNFTGMLLDRELVVALDWEPACVARLKSRYGGARNVRAFVRDLERESIADLVECRFDSCVCLNVLEHIEDDAAVLRKIFSILEPGGAVVLIVPAFSSLYGPIDERLGHYRRYRQSSLECLARAAGLRVESSRYMNVVGFFGWWVNAHLLRREEQSAAQIEIFDRCVVPLLHRVEEWIDPPFGQSLLAVLRKPAAGTMLKFPCSSVPAR